MLKFCKSKGFLQKLLAHKIIDKIIDFVASMKRMQKWRKNEKWL